MATEPEGKIIMTNTTFAAASTTNTAIDATFTTYFTFNHLKKTIVGSEFNFKMSGNPNKPQYEALMKAMAFQPNYTLAPVASTKKVEKKQTYKGLSFELMMDYVEFKGNEIQKAEFEEIVSSNATYREPFCADVTVSCILQLTAAAHWCTYEKIGIGMIQFLFLDY